MRYQVVFDHVATAWAVIDSHAPGYIVARDADLNRAKDRAWAEEERWCKAWPLTARPGR